MVVVRGEVVRTGGKLQLKVSGANRHYDLTAAPNVIEVLKTQTGKTITLEGALVPGKDLAKPVPIQVRTAR